MPEALLKPLVTSPRESDFAREVLTGLSLPQKQIPAKYFYDKRGSELFDAICRTQEYYPFRCERALLPKVAAELGNFWQEDVTVVEFGAGALVKIRSLLNHLPTLQRYIPVDISGGFLKEQAAALASQFPDVDIEPVVADFCTPVPLKGLRGATTLGFFPGSTIGNFAPDDARQFLVNAGQTLGRGSYLLIGVDTRKSPQMLHRAYNDAAGVTAAFNLNLLLRLNRELGADFDLSKFEHYAFYNPAQHRVEMHLSALEKQTVTVAGRQFAFDRGESIHTENSYKYSVEDFRRLARQAHWHTEESWLAEQGLFSMHLLHRPS